MNSAGSGYNDCEQCRLWLHVTGNSAGSNYKDCEQCRLWLHVTGNSAGSNYKDCEQCRLWLRVLGTVLAQVIRTVNGADSGCMDWEHCR